MKILNEKNKTIVILNHSSSKNLGDQSLICSTIDLIKNINQDFIIYIFSLDYNNEIKIQKDILKYKNVNVIKSFIRQPSKKLGFINMFFENLFLVIFSFFPNIFFNFLPKYLKYKIRIIKNAHLVIVRGGDNFSSIYGLKSFLSNFLPVYYVRNIKIKKIFLSHTLGPFNKFYQILFNYIFKSIDFFYIRDKYSYGNIPSHKNKIKLFPDIAFILKKETIDIKDYIKPEKMNIGFVTSGLVHRYLNLSYKDYIEQSTSFLKKISSNKNINIILIPHVTRKEDSDFKVAMDIKNGLVNNNIFLFSTKNCKKMKYFISNLDLLISARMHPQIHAISSKVPVIGIDYNNKTKSLFEYWNIKELLITKQAAKKQLCIEMLNKFDYFRANETEIKKKFDNFCIEDIYNKYKIIFD
ncbi:MAG: polysaccharide pyruvyl transferase family protein [Candidatus Pacebacteria bacterium]|nr:polysaccharide pyruvyl transferase family protein [Candidatus Paceibacterota bacterium]